MKEQRTEVGLERTKITSSEKWGRIKNNDPKEEIEER